MQDCVVPPHIAACVSLQLRELYATQTAPFVRLIQDYGQALQTAREQQVCCARLAQRLQASICHLAVT
jgi:hypothetical protein